MNVLQELERLKAENEELKRKLQEADWKYMDMHNEVCILSGKVAMYKDIEKRLIDDYCTNEEADYVGYENCECNENNFLSLQAIIKHIFRGFDRVNRRYGK